HNPDLLEKTLSSLAFPEGIRYEIVLIDNGNEAVTKGILEESGFPGKLISPGGNLGFAKANNRGIEAVGAKFFLLLNDDVEMGEGAIAKLLARIEKEEAIGVIGCRLLNPDGSLQPSCYGYPNFPKEFLKATGLKKLFPKNSKALRKILSFLPLKSLAGYWEHDAEREVESLKGACLLVRRSAIDQAGLLDENWFMYGEEMEWCFRIRQAGFKVLFSPEAQALHHGGWERRGVEHAARMLAEEYRGNILFFRKHFKGKAPLYELMLLVLMPARALILGCCAKGARSAWQVFGYALRSLLGGRP
ncbi:MAG TPA: glycosyltransferase family 2 protein, partial [Chroococcales cyanobacterium]